MTLDEAIKHAEEVAEKKFDNAVSIMDKMKSDIALKNAEECKQCAQEYRQLAEWLKELKQLREQTRWIPVNERLPEERKWIGTKMFGTTISDEVYVTFETPEGERFTKHLSFQNGKVSNFVQREIDAFYKGSVPVAWRSLPEPLESQKLLNERDIRELLEE